MVVVVVESVWGGVCTEVVWGWRIVHAGETHVGMMHRERERWEWCGLGATCWSKNTVLLSCRTLSRNARITSSRRSLDICSNFVLLRLLSPPAQRKARFWNAAILGTRRHSVQMP